LSSDGLGLLTAGLAAPLLLMPAGATTPAARASSVGHSQAAQDSMRRGYVKSCGGYAKSWTGKSKTYTI
jgi:hypothetical protein